MSNEYNIFLCIDIGDRNILSEYDRINDGAINHINREDHIKWKREKVKKMGVRLRVSIP